MKKPQNGGAKYLDGSNYIDYSFRRKFGLEIYEKRALKQDKDEDFIRHDCKDRILKLETLLENSSKEKDEMRLTILKLTEQVAALSVKVEFLQNKNLTGL